MDNKQQLASVFSELLFIAGACSLILIISIFFGENYIGLMIGLLIWTLIGLFVIGVFFPSVFIRVSNTKNPFFKGIHVVFIGIFWLIHLPWRSRRSQ